MSSSRNCEIIIGSRAQLPESLLAELSGYRYEIFVRRLGWELPNSRPGWEEDQFDTDDTIYVVARQAAQICGCGRLLPTTRRYLLQDVFPQLMPSIAPPRSRYVWELSRFAVGAATGSQARSSDLSRHLFQRICSAAAERGAKQVVGVLTVPLERVLRRFSHLERLGPPTVTNGQLLVACRTDVTQPTARLAAPAHP